MEKQLLISDSMKEQIPPFVLAELAKMPPLQQDQFVQEFNRKGKNPTLVLILTVFWLHYIYLGKWGTCILFWLTFGGMWIWWIADLFRIKTLIKDKNKDIAIEIMRNMKAVM